MSPFVLAQQFRQGLKITRVLGLGQTEFTTINQMPHGTVERDNREDDYRLAWHAFTDRHKHKPQGEK